MTVTVSAEIQKLYEELIAEYGHIREPYCDGTDRCDGYRIILYKDEDLITIHYGDDGGEPFGGGSALWIDTRGERVELEIDGDALWPGMPPQKQMFEKVRKLRAMDAEVQTHSGCGVWEVR